MIDRDLNIFDSVCTGCSACTEACLFSDKNGIKPIQLIINNKGLKVPRINSTTCKQCMMCYKACPVENKIFNSDVTFETYKEKIGNCYFGYSLDAEHRFSAATAGIATEIAAYLLDTHQVDGVISSYQNDTNQIINEIFSCSQEVRKTRGSIYRQVSLFNGLVEKIAAGNHKKLLLIGLPCHIAGLKSLQEINALLKEIDFTTIALFCKQTKTEEFSNVECSMLGVKPNTKLNYRGNGWPGVTKGEGGRCLSFINIRFSLMWGSFAFTPNYCFTCSDPLGVEADISIGDAWLKKYYGDKTGSSLFTANSEKGKSIIEEMAQKCKIYKEDENVDNICASQSKNYIKFKTTCVNERVSYWGRHLTQCNVSVKYFILLRFLIFNKKVMEFMYEKNIIRYTPEILLKVYGKMSSFVVTKIIAFVTLSYK